MDGGRRVRLGVSHFSNPSSSTDEVVQTTSLKTSRTPLILKTSPFRSFISSPDSRSGIRRFITQYCSSVQKEEVQDKGVNLILLTLPQ